MFFTSGLVGFAKLILHLTIFIATIFFQLGVILILTHQFRAFEEFYERMEDYEYKTLVQFVISMLLYRLVSSNIKFLKSK